MKTLNLGKVAVVGVALALSACQGGPDKTNVEFVQDMMENPAIKAQEFDADSPHHSGMRVPPDNTVPVGFKPYRFAADLPGAIKDLKNPIVAGDADADWVGTKMFETNCAVCHGHKGEGGEASGAVVSTFMALKPPSLLSDKVRAMSDGQIYHIITMGQGVMGPYASHVPQNQRWQVVSHIRQLQKNAGK